MNKLEKKYLFIYVIWYNAIVYLYCLCDSRETLVRQVNELTTRNVWTKRGSEHCLPVNELTNRNVWTKRGSEHCLLVNAHDNQKCTD